MKDMDKLLILESDPVARKALEKSLQKEGIDQFCTVLTPEEDKNDPKMVKIWLLDAENIKKEAHTGHFFAKPVRIGAVLALIHRLLAGNFGNEVISIGPYQLNTLNYDLIEQKTGRVIRLTEKESQILALLAQRPGEIVSRKALLENVWNYADGIETHTLETHIYRLRQKIEKDPANPALLLTEEAGYKLG
jgi:hypothetical protein